MNKLIAVLAALSGAASLNAQDLSMSANFGFESDYYFRGVQLADSIYTGGIDLSYGDFYAGIWSANPSDSEYPNEVDFYMGYGVALTDLISADFGVTYYTYPDADDDIFDGDVNTAEFYAGVALDVFLSPSFYIYYDEELENWTGEFSAGYSAPLSEKSSLDFAGYVGGVDLDEGADYFYTGLSVDYIYNFTDSASFSIGGRFTAATEDYAKYGEDDADFWGGASFTCGF